MILKLATRYSKDTAFGLLILFYLQFLIPMWTSAMEPEHVYRHVESDGNPAKKFPHRLEKTKQGSRFNQINGGTTIRQLHQQHPDIGGPSSPEASSFKAVGADNLVNLFTGDFSYSIPLLDVGGYPVNLFYSGGVTMDQEASWVGLGWNINPGSVTRNMRGVPDDFDGSDQLTQIQNVKPNRTWGAELGIDGQFFGIHKPAKVTLGFSYNNYLGPELDLGISSSIALSKVKTVGAEKTAPSPFGPKLGVGGKLSSRSGLTISPSLNAMIPLGSKGLTTGQHLSTSYNSRTGIRDLTLSSEFSYSRDKLTKPANPTAAQSKMDYNNHSLSAGLLSSTISFARTSYMPTLRLPMSNHHLSGELELGAGAFGLVGDLQGSGYYSVSKLPDWAKSINKPLYGYIYSEKAARDQNAVMDFNRLNDAEVTPNTSIISAPQYTYDIFSIQGEGTGGTIRAYRGNLGFMKDNTTRSTDEQAAIGLDIAPPGHYGINWNDVSSPTFSGSWRGASNTLNNSMQFREGITNDSFEHVYFKNPGECSVVNADLINELGGDNIVRFKLNKDYVSTRVESRMGLFKQNGLRQVGEIGLPAKYSGREKRTQVTTMLTAKEASQIGLDTILRNYKEGDTLSFMPINRVSGYRKAHHISEIDVLEQSGMRYVYGLPVYNIVQKDFTFSVKETQDGSSNVVRFAADEATPESPLMDNDSEFDGYVQNQITPGYAHSFLLTGLLSPDYVDVTADGITEDDLGTAVRFNYSKTTDVHKWRTPRESGDPLSAHFNHGLRTEKRDNKASISYGERENWYLHSIESKSMIAIFIVDSSRKDGKGVMGEMNGNINANEFASRKLSRIDLYTKAEIKSKGFSAAKPIKSVLFEYDYTLCMGTPDYKYLDSGKLTLRAVTFAYNGQYRAKKDRYVFNYGSTPADNPSYANGAADRWGTYKDPSSNHTGLTNIDQPYTPFSPQQRDTADKNAAAWSLKKILLPSGGQMEIQYEADDYAYVQDKRASNMFQLAGFGTTKLFQARNELYNGIFPDNFYFYVKLDQPLLSDNPDLAKKEILSRYVDGMKQLAFKLFVNMPEGEEPLICYAEFDDYGICLGDGLGKQYIYFHLKDRNQKSPLAVSATGFIANNLPAQAFPGYDIHVSGLEAFVSMEIAMLNSLKNAFANVDDQMRSASKAQTVNLSRSFVRLANPRKIKYGGGIRVKRVLVRDNWNRMTGAYGSTYGQDYDYTKTEAINGQPATISSGVASYEPSVGSEENPFRENISFNNDVPLASAIYGSTELPVLDGFFPAPCVGYSKVTVRSIHRKGTHSDSTLRSAIGKQVTEYYTARDFPTVACNTPLDVREYHKPMTMSLFYKELIDRKTVSQGFLVQTNDMHGKIKSQQAYSESDTKNPLTASYHTYRNTGKNGLNDKVDFVYAKENGAVHQGNMGVDVELMTDVREFDVSSSQLNIQGQVEIFVLIAYPAILPICSEVENNYKAVTCTKLINYHAIEDTVVVMDKGSTIKTVTTTYDAETGVPVVTKTENEYNDPVYKVTYPAYWAYSGTGPAYGTIGMEFTTVDIENGKIVAPLLIKDIFESGDELWVSKQGTDPGTCIPISGSVTRIWAYDLQKNSTALTSATKNLVFMDAGGNLINRHGMSFKIVRCGKRNNLGLTVAEATTLVNPIRSGSLVLDDNSKVLATSAVVYKEKWAIDNGVIDRMATVADSCSGSEYQDCSGYLEKRINPYRKGLIGTLRPYRSLVFYGERAGQGITSTPLIRKMGYISGFTPYWIFDSIHKLVPQAATNWVWNSELTRVNSKGQELETRDALNIYTSAQYGFGQSLPVAMTKNARAEEAVNESFEDINFQDALRVVGNRCEKRHLDLRSLSGSALAKTDTLGFNAHSGSYVFRVNGGITPTKIIPIAKNTSDTYELALAHGLKGPLLEQGVTVDSYYFFNSNLTPRFTSTHKPSFDHPDSGFWFHFEPVDQVHFCSPDDEANSTDVLAKYFYFHTNSYFEVTRCGWFKIRSYANFYRLSDNALLPVFFGEYDFKKLDGTLIYHFNGSSAYDSTVTIFLAPGIYQVNASILSGGERDCHRPTPCLDDVIVSDTTSSTDTSTSRISTSGGSNCDTLGYYDGQFSWMIKMHRAETDSLLTAYQTTYTACGYDAPIPAKDSMINPTYQLIPGKKMLISTWIREGCTSSGGIPCSSTQYTHSQVGILFNDSVPTHVNFSPAGPVIEGWQKIEGSFTVPLDATQATLQFVNSGSQPMYLDDLRIHPYNANMKSYVYDTRTLRLCAELDENNYAAFYEYDEEGQLVRVKKETVQGVKTIKETRSAKQKAITDVQ